MCPGGAAATEVRAHCFTGEAFSLRQQVHFAMRLQAAMGASSMRASKAQVCSR